MLKMIKIYLIKDYIFQNVLLITTLVMNIISFILTKQVLIQSALKNTHGPECDNKNTCTKGKT